MMMMMMIKEPGRILVALDRLIMTLMRRRLRDGNVHHRAGGSAISSISKHMSRL